jgi:hypothetical protein
MEEPFPRCGHCIEHDITYWNPLYSFFHRESPTVLFDLRHLICYLESFRYHSFKLDRMESRTLDQCPSGSD